MKTRRELARKALRKGYLPPVPRALTTDERMALVEINSIVAQFRWQTNQLRRNTALVPGGQALLEQFDALTKVYEQAERQFAGDLLIRCGYPPGMQCSFNMTTGEVIIHNDEPANDTNAEVAA